MSDIKYLNLREFLDSGMLQEVNRLFFHPMGLALEVVVEDDGSVALGGIWDYRDDPEGIIFGDEITRSPEFVEKIDRVTDMFLSKRDTRINSFGWHIQQPVGSNNEHEE